VDTDDINYERYYDLSIVYDKYYCTPRLYLTGVDCEGQPLTNDQIFEDIMSTYLNKTVTIETHPF
jgi:ubiquitin-like-conjugating enzyme ATG3